MLCVCVVLYFVLCQRRSVVRYVLLGAAQTSNSDFPAA